MEAVTVDTNILPLNDLESLAAEAGYALEIISVTARELAGTDLLDAARNLGQTYETAMFGEAFFDGAVLGDIEHAGTLEEILKVISSGSFPAQADRDELTPPQRNQLRDALILQAHIRSGKRIFVTGDAKAYIKHGRRELFESRYRIAIYTKAEFLEHCQARIGG